MISQIKIRRDIGTNWESLNPVLVAGEFGFDTTNKVLKIGDGATAWNSLNSFAQGEEILQYTTLANFPENGNNKNIYIDKTENKTYRWDDDLGYVMIGGAGGGALDIDDSSYLDFYPKDAQGTGDFKKIFYNNSNFDSIEMNDLTQELIDTITDLPANSLIVIENLVNSSDVYFNVFIVPHAISNNAAGGFYGQDVYGVVTYKFNSAYTSFSVGGIYTGFSNQKTRIRILKPTATKKIATFSTNFTSEIFTGNGSITFTLNNTAAANDLYKKLTNMENNEYLFFTFPVEFNYEAATAFGLYIKDSASKIILNTDTLTVKITKSSNLSYHYMGGPVFNYYTQWANYSGSTGATIFFVEDSFPALTINTETEGEKQIYYSYISNSLIGK